MKEKADYTVDVRGTILPFSLLKVTHVFQQMKPSEVVEILGCDAEMRQDLLRLLPDASFEMAHAQQPSLMAGVSVVRCRKTQPR